MVDTKAKLPPNNIPFSFSQNVDFLVLQLRFKQRIHTGWVVLDSLLQFQHRQSDIKVQTVYSNSKKKHIVTCLRLFVFDLTPKLYELTLLAQLLIFPSAPVCQSVTLTNTVNKNILNSKWCLPLKGAICKFSLPLNVLSCWEQKSFTASLVHLQYKRLEQYYFFRAVWTVQWINKRDGLAGQELAG